MEPLLYEGDEVLATRPGGLPQVGQVWVLWHPLEAGRKVVKLVSEELAGNQFRVLGLNSEMSQDSRTFGPVKGSQFLGRVTSLWTEGDSAPKENAGG